jgi:hypothetical protein
MTTTHISKLEELSMLFFIQQGEETNKKTCTRESRRQERTERSAINCFMAYASALHDDHLCLSFLKGTIYASLKQSGCAV